MLVPIPPVGPLPWFMSRLIWDLCSLVLEGKRLLLPFNVETDLGSTSVDDSSELFKNSLPKMMGALSSLPVSITMKSAQAYKVPTWM